jgi:uncharacterized protein involved in exopolysaccharide biosynthesis
LNEYRIILRRRKYLVLGCVAGGLALAACLNEFTTPVYKSSVRVEVQREASRSPLTGAVTETPTPQSDDQALFTAAQIVTSRLPMAEVVSTLDRQGTPIGAAPRRFWPFRAKSGAASRAPRSVADKVDWLLAHVTVEPLRDTRLIRISVEASDPATAARIANTIADNFVRYQAGQRSAADNTVATYLRSQAADVQSHIKALERHAQGSDQPGLFALESKIQQLTATLAEYNASYSKATTERLAVSSQLDRVKLISRDSKIDRSEIPVHTEALDALRRDLLVSNTALAKAREIYGGSHPKFIQLKSENDEIRRNMREEFISAVGSLESQRSILVGREESLRAALAKGEDDLRDLNDQARRYSTSEGELKSNRDLYTLLTSRIHEAEITGQLTRPSVRIVEPASLELGAVRPRKMLNVAIGLLLGLLSGTGMAFLLESLRKTIRTPKDVDELLQLPVLGLIPKDSLR